MTPTLSGRWQTRLLLMSTIGLIISLGFGWLYHDYGTTLSLLGYVMLLGLIWDVLYQFLQSFRWDGDWPPIFYVIGGLAEGALLWALVTTPLLPSGLPGVSADLALGQFTAHYVTVWLAVFTIIFGPMKVIFPRWRFNGGQFR